MSWTGVLRWEEKQETEPSKNVVEKVLQEGGREQVTCTVGLNAMRTNNGPLDLNLGWVLPWHKQFSSFFWAVGSHLLYFSFVQVEATLNYQYKDSGITLPGVQSSFHIYWLLKCVQLILPLSVLLFKGRKLYYPPQWDKHFAQYLSHSKWPVNGIKQSVKLTKILGMG